VAFRAGDILETTEITNWQWVLTKENPADDATRDFSAPDINSSSRWLAGPAFLKMEEKDWPHEKVTSVADDKDEIRSSYVSSTHENTHEHLPDLGRFSSWRKLMRVTAWIFRFIHNF